MHIGKHPQPSEALPIRLRALRFGDRFAALGMVTSYLMTKPAFARLPFGHWARLLTGQVNRSQYLFICDDNSVLGFAGWAFASANDAEAWLAGVPLPTVWSRASDSCLILDAWSADRPDVHKLLLREIRRMAAGVAAVYARREYADGHSRPVRLNISPADSRFIPLGRTGPLIQPSPRPRLNSLRIDPEF